MFNNLIFNISAFSPCKYICELPILDTDIACILCPQENFAKNPSENIIYRFFNTANIGVFMRSLLGSHEMAGTSYLPMFNQISATQLREYRRKRYYGINTLFRSNG
jgi:hypothetical protein